MKNNYTYPGILEKTDEQEFIISFPAFDCLASGKSSEEGIENSQELLSLYILDYLDTGIELLQSPKKKI